MYTNMSTAVPPDETLRRPAALWETISIVSPTVLSPAFWCMRNPGSLPEALPLVLALIAALAVCIVLYQFGPSLRLTREALIVRNHLTVLHVPWHAVDGVAGAELRVRGGGRFPLRALKGADREPWFRVSAAAAVKARAGRGGDAPVVVRPAWDRLAVYGACAVSVAVAMPW